eukprot:1989345-Amphidinium_carterae.1
MGPSKKRVKEPFERQHSVKDGAFVADRKGLELCRGWQDNSCTISDSRCTETDVPGIRTEFTSVQSVSAQITVRTRVPLHRDRRNHHKPRRSSLEGSPRARPRAT